MVEQMQSFLADATPVAERAFGTVLATYISYTITSQIDTKPTEQMKSQHARQLKLELKSKGEPVHPAFKKEVKEHS